MCWGKAMQLLVPQERAPVESSLKTLTKPLPNTINYQSKQKPNVSNIIPSLTRVVAASWNRSKPRQWQGASISPEKRVRLRSAGNNAAQRKALSGRATPRLAGPNSVRTGQPHTPATPTNKGTLQKDISKQQNEPTILRQRRYQTRTNTNKDRNQK